MKNLSRHALSFQKKHYAYNQCFTRKSYFKICDHSLITDVMILSLEGVQRGTVFLCVSQNMMHYWHAFYDLEFNQEEKIALGKYLMLTAITHAKNLRFSYLYLGAAYDKNDYYKINDWGGLFLWNGQNGLGIFIV